MTAVDTTIRQGDCIELMREMPAGTIDLVFADPPFNIGYEYDKYDDDQSDDAYLDWSRNWMEEVHRLLKPAGSFWLAIGDEYAADLKVIADRQIGFTTRSWVVWYYTFGVNCKRKFSRSHVHLFHFVKDPDKFTFNADDPEVRIPSARALVYGDKRANPKGRLPDDTWILRPQDFQSDVYGFDPIDDTWYFARVAGTFKERQGFHGCQMPEQLLGRILRVSSNPGDIVFDPFTGSGTTLAVAKKLGRQWQGCELSEDYVRYATERIERVNAGDKLDGPADAIASAPTTANGRRLKQQPLLPVFEETDFAPPEGLEIESHQPRSNGRTAPDAQPAIDEAPVAQAPSPAPANQAVPSVAPADLRTLQSELLAQAFVTATGGYSIERFLADPQLQAKFHATCANAGLLGTPAIWNAELLGLRKAGKLPKQTVKQPTALSVSALDNYQFAAEIAWQLTREKFGESSLVAIFSSPEWGEQFDRLAGRYAPGHSPSDYRRAALLLRKNQAALAAEAKEYHYVFRTRDFHSSRKLTSRIAKSYQGQGGVYLLMGPKKSPLFVGETLDLGARLACHAEAPATKKAVQNFSVILESDLPSSSYRAPLKVDLVNRLKPTWNVQ